MTEERFELIWETDEMCNIFDNDFASTISVEEVVDLINDYDRRCNRWVSENKRLKKEIMLIEKRADRVYEENEQLKSRVNDLEDLNRIYVDFMVSKGYELSDVME